MRPVALFDSNVWVSAFLNPFGAPAQLKDAWLADRIDVVASVPLLAEVSDVLRRPRIKRKYRIPEADIVAYCELIAIRTALVPVAGTLTVCRDPDDDRILEAALAGNVQYLVTRDDDIKHDPAVRQFLKSHAVQVATVSHMLQILAHAQGGLTF